MGEFMPGMRAGLGDKDLVDPDSTTGEVSGRAELLSTGTSGTCSSTIESSHARSSSGDSAKG